MIKIKGFSVSAGQFQTNDDSFLKISIPTIKNLKIIKAKIKLIVSTFTDLTNSGIFVNYKFIKNGIIQTGWNNVDHLRGLDSSNIIYIDFTDELQSTINNNGSDLLLYFDCSNASIKFDQDCFNNNLDIEAISLEEYQTNASYNNFNFDSAGNGKVNLSTGEFSLNRLDFNVTNNALDLSVVHNFNNIRKNSLYMLNDDKFNTHCGYGWNLNIQQYLKKLTIGDESVNEDVYTKSNLDNLLRFEYIDSEGKSQIIEEKYYYLDENNDKVFVRRENVEVNLDGSLVYQTNDNIIKEVQTLLKSSTGLNLISSIKDIKGSNLVDYEPEELSNIRKQIAQLEKTIEKVEETLKTTAIQIYSYKISKFILSNDISNNYSYYNGSSESGDFRFNDNIFKYYTLYIDNGEISSNDHELSVKIPYQLNQVGIEKEELAKYKQDFLDAWKTSNSPCFLQGIDLLTSDINYEKLCQTFDDYHQNLQDANDQLTKLKHQEMLYELQVPVHYLYSDDNIIYGFGKTYDNNIFRLVYITDMFENSYVINYEDLNSNKILSITDSSNKITTFNYNKENLLISLIDPSDNKLTFAYDENKRLKLVKQKDKIICRYCYDTNNNLISVIDRSGLGSKLSYTENGQVVKVHKLSLIESINSEKINFKNGLDLKFDDSLNLETYLINDNYVNFNYYDYKTTYVSNKDKNVVYVFNRYGQVVHTYEDNYSNEINDICVNLKQYTYQEDLKNESISILPYSHNYLANTLFNGQTITYSPSLYLGSTLASDYSISIPSFISEKTSIHKLTANVNSINQDSVTVNQIEINNINSNGIKNLVLVGWAKANSAFVVNNDDVDKFLDENSTIAYPSYISNRKFEIKANILYKNETSPIVISKQFDWMNTGWQYCALPIKLDANKEVASIVCYIDYSYNTGDIEYTNFELHEGAWETKNYNEENLLISTETDKYTITYEYDENHNLIKETLHHDNKEYTTCYEYNKNNKLIKTISYNGIVTENVYNDVGENIKNLTYHKDNLSSKYVDERVLDEKGNETYVLNELGDKVSSFDYDTHNSLVYTETDCKGNKVVYGYNSDNVMNSMSATVNDEENTNLYGYTLSFLTSLSHNNFDIKYEYDEQGRQNKVIISDEEYLSKTYNVDGESVRFASGDIFKTKSSTQVKEVYLNEQLLIKDIYDIYGNLTQTEDYANNETHITKNIFNKYGRTTGKTSEQHNIQLTFADVVNYNDNVESSSITIGNKSLNYSFDHEKDLDAKLNNVTLKDGNNNKIFEQNISYDKLGRTSEVTFNNKVKQYHYLKSGDHCSNLVSSVWYGENNKINDNVKYKYDTKGNILEIRENGILTNRYKYDSLSRLVREDNKELNKTTTYEYDIGGNIIQKVEYAYSLNEELSHGTPINYNYPISGWRDQLLSYNGESISYDILGNPTTYRNKIFNWSHGRQLDEIKGVATYKYNANGIRISKTINNVTTKFYLNNNKILAQDNGNILYFNYGVDGIVGFTLDIPGLSSQNFTYKKNIQGDIIGIYNSNNVLFCKYVYDAWGKQSCHVLRNNGEYVDILTSSSYTDISSNYILVANLNPFRYRGYYYDAESKLYYLNTRYYDPETGRFINADEITYIDGKNLNGFNLYMYCANNPVMFIDINGTFFLTFVATLVASATIGYLAYRGIEAATNTNVANGSSSIAGGISTIATSASLFAYGPVGWVLGGIGIIAGIGLTLFGSAELQEGVSGENWIKDAGMSDGLYNGLYLASSISSFIVSVLGSAYMVSPLGQRAYAYQNIGKYQFSIGSSKHLDRSYYISTYTQKNIIKLGKMNPDSGGYMFKAPGYFNGRYGIFELLLSNKTKQIWHMVFKKR